MSFHQKLEQSTKTPLELPATGSWPQTPHRMQEEAAMALISAMAAGRPLLVKGEPGVGKSQLARAAAEILGWAFISTVIQPNSEYEELIWRVDYTQRLADAQLAGALCGQAAVTGDHNTKDNDTEDDSGHKLIEQIGRIEHYLSPGPLWYAMDWQSAAQKQCQQSFSPPKDMLTPDYTSRGVVLLIDEIDKADISLTNGLLEVLGNGRFQVSMTGETIQPNGLQPLIVMTSNETRELPAAIVRRCVILDMALPDEQEALQAHFQAVGQTHYPALDEAVLNAVIEQIISDRLTCQQLPKTGQAEFIDLLRALDSVSQNPAEQKKWLEKLAHYFCKSGR